MADFQLVDVNVLKTLFEVRYDTAFIQERTRECNDLWRGYCNGINWGRNTLAKAQIIDALIIPKSGIGDLSDGYHTFNELYYQRLILFAALVRQHKDRAWKSFRHEDGELCFGGGWFIVGIDTPEGSYTYHYENKDFDLFDCVELPVGKHWDGHTEKDVTRLLSLPCDEAQRWIPVTERMPELIPCNAGTAYSEAVNVLTSGRKVVTAIWDGTEFIADAAFWEADGETITHWAPVPLPLPELAGG